MEREVIDKKELKEVELRSEELQEVMGKIPPWILRRGIAVLFCVVVVLLTGSAFFTYPDMIQAPVMLTGSMPPAGVIAFSSGKLDMMNTQDNQIVKAGDYLAVIHNAAQTDDVLYLKRFLDELDIEKDLVFDIWKSEDRSESQNMSLLERFVMPVKKIFKEGIQ